MRIFVVGDNESVMSRVRDAVIENRYECPISNVLSLDLATRELAANKPDLTLLILAPDSEVALTYLDQVRPGDWGLLVAIGPSIDAKVVLRAIRTGIDDYVDDAELAVQLKLTLERVGNQLLATAKHGKVIACVSACGGCGATTLAVNLAAALATDSQSAALVDLNLEAGDSAALLDLEPSHTIADLCENLGRADQYLFEKLLEKHQAGIYLLAAPTEYPQISQVTPEGIYKSLVLARAMFPFVIVDIDRPAHSGQAEALVVADRVMLVLRLDFACLRNARRIIDQLEQLGVDPNCVTLVANRQGQPREVPRTKAMAALEVKEMHCIPNDPKNVNLANNMGVPVVIERPSARVSESIRSLAQRLNGEA